MRKKKFFVSDGADINLFSEEVDLLNQTDLVDAERIILSKDLSILSFFISFFLY